MTEEEMIAQLIDGVLTGHHRAVYLADQETGSYIGSVTWVCACQTRREQPPWRWKVCPECACPMVRTVISRGSAG